MTSSCLFCKIAAKEVPAQIVYEDELCVAFQDINPQAPVHLLVIPRKHLSSGLDSGKEDEPMMGHLHAVAAELARRNDITEGCRLVVNMGAGAGQTVFHHHIHVMGGREFHWPPG